MAKVAPASEATVSASAAVSQAPSISQTALDSLREAMCGGIATDEPTLRAYSIDRSGVEPDGVPVAVVWPETTEQVQAAVRWASEHGVSVVPRGAGTGLAGSATAGAGSLVVCLERMNKVLEVSADDRLCVVQPGILNDELNAVLHKDGLWWPPDPASKAISTVGGNIAANAGGFLCAKYGVTQQWVLGLTVVLADGRVMSMGRRTVKGVSGYDVTSMLIGSEGTLGIIVECVLKVRPLQSAEVATLVAVCDSAVDAAAAASAVTAAHLQPAMMELLDEVTSAAVVGHLVATDETFVDPTEGRATSLLLVQTDGLGAEAELSQVHDAVAGFARHVRVAESVEETEALIGMRRAVFPAIERMGGSVLVEDIAVPRTRMAEAFTRMREIERKYEVALPSAAHAGDGNMHPVFVFEPVAGETGLDAVPTHVWEAADEVFSVALEMGGTLTGEHGVGLLKKRFLPEELGADQTELQQQLRKVFDPQGIMNPGKVLD